ncbi:MAG: hypothetical protein ACLU62_12915, partial [Hydrogeniiclostridium sp.]
FLLSHYHRDRFSAMQDILLEDKNYFSAVFCPASPCDRRGHPLLLEYGIFMEVFLKDGPGYDAAAAAPLYLFSEAPGYPSLESLRLLRAGDTFSVGNVLYEALWPDQKKYPFGELFAAAVEEMNVCVSSPFLPPEAARFRQWKEEFCREWLRCGEAPSKDAWEKGKELLAQLPVLREELSTMPFAPDVREILNRPVTRSAYRWEADGASLVFHNRRVMEASLDDILLTGDATPETMDRISSKLYEGYFAVKVPGRGLPSHWSHVFGEISCQHFLISGPSRAEGEEAIAGEYLELSSMRHCTFPEACRWYRASGRSCNRMNVCYDLSGQPALSIKCPFVNGEKPDTCGCRIFIVSEAGVRSCLCDGLPAAIH